MFPLVDMVQIFNALKRRDTNQSGVSGLAVQTAGSPLMPYDLPSERSGLGNDASAPLPDMWDVWQSLERAGVFGERLNENPPESGSRLADSVLGGIRASQVRADSSRLSTLGYLPGKGSSRLVDAVSMGDEPYGADTDLVPISFVEPGNQVQKQQDRRTRKPGTSLRGRVSAPFMDFAQAWGIIEEQLNQRLPSAGRRKLWQAIQAVQRDLPKSKRLPAGAYLADNGSLMAYYPGPNSFAGIDPYSIDLVPYVTDILWYRQHEQRKSDHLSQDMSGEVIPRLRQKHGSGLTDGLSGDVNTQLLSIKYLQPFLQPGLRMPDGWHFGGLGPDILYNGSQVWMSVQEYADLLKQHKEQIDYDVVQYARLEGAKKLPDPQAPPGVDLRANAAEAKRHSILDTSWWIRSVTDNGPWDYLKNKNHKNSPRIEDFGNFHFGYVGAAWLESLGSVGLSILENGAGSNQEEKVKAGFYGTGPQPSKGNSGFKYLPWFGGVPPYGDDPVDNYWIRRGYEAYWRDKLLRRVP
jgi:hypothetical protein